MAARTRTIQRTPNVGLTLKMQPLAEPVTDCCEPAPTVARWYNEGTDAWDLETVSIYAGRLYDTSAEIFAAQVLGDLCDCAVQWDVIAEHGDGYDPSLARQDIPLIDAFVIRTPGTGLALSLSFSYAPGVTLTGVLTATPTVTCARSGDQVTLAPIYLVIEYMYS